MYIYLFIYIYICRERERERDLDDMKDVGCMNMTEHTEIHRWA